MKKLQISSSVGKGCENNRQDVLDLQRAINQISKKIGMKYKLKEDGYFGDALSESKTYQAIVLLQRKLAGFLNPDGKVDVDGRTIKVINEALSGEDQQQLSLFLPRIEPIKGISEEDFINASSLLSCDVAAIKAVSDVESSGSGFLQMAAPAYFLRHIIFQD